MFAKFKYAFKISWAKIRFALLNIKYKKSIKTKSFAQISGKSQIIAQNANVVIGEKVTIMPGCYLSSIDGGSIVLGDKVFLNRNCTLVSRGKIIIGNGTSFGPNVSIYDHNHYFGSKHKDEKGFNVGAVIIGENCWIGNGVIILKGTKIGKNCVIGAGTVIKHDIPDNSLVTSDRAIDIIPIV